MGDSCPQQWCQKDLSFSIPSDKRYRLHKDLSFSIPPDKSKQFNSYVQIQSKYHGFV